MVKNNGIPIEVNKKPFETVQELKNEYETPSFEEFMETYEADEKIIDSYRDEIEYVNGWVSKGSGPCSWDNKDCECYLPRFISLYLPCPATDCKATNKQPSFWKHSGCGGRMYIEEDAWIKCMSCSEYGYITDWSFACRHHNGQHWKTRNEDCIEALSVAMSVYKDKTSAVRKVAGKIIQEILRRDGN
jgi:hypothetical protein